MPVDQIINGNDVEEILSFKSAVENDRSEAGRSPVVSAIWEGASRSRIEYGDIVSHIGGEGEMNAMQTLLGALAACDVDLIAMHAALVGLPIESLTVETNGQFNVASYLGIPDSPGSGYQRISYRVRLRAPGATQEQVDYLRGICETGSPVGDSLQRSIPLSLEFILE